MGNHPSITVNDEGQSWCYVYVYEILNKTENRVQIVDCLQDGTKCCGTDKARFLDGTRVWSHGLSKQEFVNDIQQLEGLMKPTISGGRRLSPLFSNRHFSYCRTKMPSSYFLRGMYAFRQIQTKKPFPGSLCQQFLVTWVSKMLQQN